MGKFGGGLRPPCGTIRGTFGRGPYVRSNVGPVEPLSTLRNRSELNVRLWVTSRHRLMVSALGQKRTFRSANVMSALLPICFVVLASYDAVSNHRLVSVHGGCVLTRKIRHRGGNEETILVASYLKTGVSTATAPRVQLPCTPVVADSLGESRGWSGGWARLFHFNHVGYPQDARRNARITLTRMFAALRTGAARSRRSVSIFRHPTRSA